jgi:predicted methyltransferase MtxX (methanogen marker protein 4)
MPPYTRKCAFVQNPRRRFIMPSVDFNTDRRIGNAFDLSLLAGEFLRKWLSYAICNKTVEVAVGEP